MTTVTDNVREHFDAMSADYDRLTAKSHYYHRALIASLREVVPTGSRVLEVGSATGDILAALEPADGLGIDLSPAMIERAKRQHPELRFDTVDILTGSVGETFDYVISVNVVEHVPDLGRAVQAMADATAPGGVLVLITPHPAWAFPFWVAERLGSKVPEGWHEWRTRRDLVRAGEAAGLRLRFFDRDFVVPREAPLLSHLNTAAWALPLRRGLGVIQRAVFTKPLPTTPPA